MLQGSPWRTLYVTSSRRVGTDRQRRQSHLDHHQSSLDSFHELEMHIVVKGPIEHNAGVVGRHR